MRADRMNVGAALIWRWRPAYCASGGSAIMSQMPQSEVEALLDSRSLHALTPMTIVDRARILELVEQARLDGFSVTNQAVLLGEIDVSSPITDAAGRAQGAGSGGASCEERAGQTV